MIIKDLEVFPLSLPMKQSFQISGGTVGDSNQGAPHVYVKIVSEDGSEGWGEARPSHRWSYETIETVVSTIQKYIKPMLIGKKADDLTTIHELIDKEISSGFSKGQPICKAAVDMALYDLIGKNSNKTLSEIWLGKSKENIDLSYLISTRNIEDAVKKARYAHDNGYKAVDVKIGFNVDTDMEVLEAVKVEAPNLFFRVDANQGYTLPEAIKAAKKMENIGVDVFEQPLKANDLLGARELRRKTSVPIALDESIWSPSDVLQAIRLEACDYAVIKLTKMGGITGAKLAGEIAKEANLGLLGGGLTESTLGLTSSAHLFNYLGIEIPSDLNGPFFLEDDPIQNKKSIEAGAISLPSGYGIGCVVDSKKLEVFKFLV
ncbi:mandelate racemase/muconate lactonizing enzyme family protein [Bacillus timonensis]|uniref:mandelate racemase/muconate lactonizing enzyme family protein n=1 Tax=Bacillus timonensis TaxID=1033734 RepID=UPI00028975CD|nr:enolase C-terminal domain-like protein [Bacillus timonensis]